MTRLILSSLLFLTLLWAQPAQAQLIQRMSTAELSKLMNEEGYSTTVDADGDLIWKIEGYRTLLVIGSSKNNLLFRASFAQKGVPLSKVNAWNQSKRYSRAYLDSDGDPALQLDLDMDGGVGKERIKDFLKTCGISLRTWLKEVVN
jgi:hypothetical protein